MPTLKLPAPHATQQQVIDTARRFNVLCCGRRWGKTALAMDRLIHAALLGRPTAWFSPTYKQLSDPWRALKLTLKPITVRVNEVEHMLELRGGGSITCWSLDNPDSGRGRAYACIVVDEAALVVNLEAAWQEGIRPMLTDHKGTAWFLSTPKGVANHFHALYQRGQDPNQADWMSWQMPTSANPFMDALEVEAARGDLTELAFNQEYLALFVNWEGSVFRRILEAVMEPMSGEPAVAIGCDWALTSDYTVFTAISASGHVVGIDRFRGIGSPEQRDRLFAFWERHGIGAQIFAETNGLGGPIVQELEALGYPVYGFTTSNRTKSEVIRQLALAFERGVIKIPNDPVLIGEVQAYEGKTLPSGAIGYGAPSGVHDDMVMSLAIAWAGKEDLGMPRERVQYLDPNTGRYGDEPVPYRISVL